MVQHEANEQEALFRWALYNRMRFPELDLLFHIPNGGSRNRIEAAHLKRQGVKPGVPDLCLPVARGGRHGLFIELKYGRNRPTAEQKAWLQDLDGQDYETAVCYGWEQAVQTIETYLKGAKNHEGKENH